MALSCWPVMLFIQCDDTHVAVMICTGWSYPRQKARETRVSRRPPSQPSPWVGPGKPNLPLGLRGTAGGDAFELWWWRRLLRVPWTARRFNQSILKDSADHHSHVCVIALDKQHHRPTGEGHADAFPLSEGPGPVTEQRGQWRSLGVGRSWEQNRNQRRKWDTRDGYVGGRRVRPGKSRGRRERLEGQSKRLGSRLFLLLFPACRAGWPWEAQSSPRVARESWGWRSSHCRA